jgi:predicted ferric reductase
MRSVAAAVFWLTVYMLLVLAPLLVLAFGRVPAGTGFWWDLSMALGFAGLAMMAVQFLLTARFKRLTAPYGIDIIYFFHRYLAVIAFLLIVTHLAILYFVAPTALTPRSPMAAPAHMTAGRIALLLFALVIFSSLFRKQIRLEYDHWRLWHVVLTILAMLLAIGHVEGVGYYIEAPLKQLLWTAYSLFWVLLIIYVRLVKPWRMHRCPYRVVEVRPERGHVTTLRLQPECHTGMHFSAGQFAWLSLNSPYALKEHPFSFSSSPQDSGEVAFTIKELGDFTRTIKDVKPGTVAYVDGPYGNFTLERYAQAPALVFIAGGVGIAPIMSMLRSLAAQHDPRPLLLLYGNQDWERVTFREELDSLTQQLPLHIVHVLRQPPADWQGERDFIDDACLQRHITEPFRMAEFFICGPGPMRKAMEKLLHRQGIPLLNIHSEIFDLA